MKRLAVLCLFCLLGMSARVDAQDRVPTTQRDAGADPTWFPTRRPRAFFGQGPQLEEEYRAIPDAEREAAMAYTKQYSPSRYKLFLSLPENRPARFRAGLIMVDRYRQLKAIEKTQPQLAALMTKRIGLEDEIFTIVLEIKSRKPDDPFVESQKTQLREKVSDLLDIGQEERKIRIDNLQKVLEKEKQSMAGEIKNREELIQSRIERFMAESRPFGGGGGFGPGGPQPPGDPTATPASSEAPPRP